MQTVKKVWLTGVLAKPQGSGGQFAFQLDERLVCSVMTRWVAMLPRVELASRASPLPWVSVSSCEQPTFLACFQCRCLLVSVWGQVGIFYFSFNWLFRYGVFTYLMLKQIWVLIGFGDCS